MRKILLVTLLISITSCGGGGGLPLKKEVVIHNIDLQKSKTSYSENFRTKKELLFWNTKYPDSMKTKRSEFMANNSHKYILSVPFIWQNKEYKIACDKKGGTWYGAFAILDLKNNVITHNKTPRYTTGTVVLPVKDKNNKDYLVALIKHQSTSFSSSLFIFDKDFNLVYKEFLGIVDWVAADNNFKNIFYIYSRLDKQVMWKYTL